MIDHLLPQLRERQVALALETLRYPKSEAEYRQRCGEFKALDDIINDIEGLLKDADERDGSL